MKVFKTPLKFAFFLFGIFYILDLTQARQDSESIEAQDLTENESEDIETTPPAPIFIKPQLNLKFLRVEVKNGSGVIRPSHSYKLLSHPQIQRQFYRLQPFQNLILTCTASFPIQWTKLYIGDGEDVVDDQILKRSKKSYFSSTISIIPDDLDESGKFSYGVYHCVGKKKVNQGSKVTIRLYLPK